MSANKPYAYMWYCGEECSCSCPRISFFTETEKDRKEEILWEGDFHTETSPEDYAAQCRELVARAREYAVVNLAAIEAEFMDFIPLDGVSPQGGAK